MPIQESTSRTSKMTGVVTTLPEDSDTSVAVIRDSLTGESGVEIGVVVSDKFNRPCARAMDRSMYL